MPVSLPLLQGAILAPPRDGGAGDVSRFPGNVVFKCEDVVGEGASVLGERFDVITWCGSPALRALRAFVPCALCGTMPRVASRKPSTRLRSFSVTKWIHLNHGDRGVKELFKRAYSMLTDGGMFVRARSARMGVA